jgi:hypothetical protein
VEITCRVYRPRKPRDSPLFQLVERHLEELLRLWPSRFARQHGPLRPVVERVLREFLRCGLLEDTSAYLVRNPLSLKKLVYLDGEKAVVYRSRMNPSLGRNFEAMDPLEWLARLSDHIPDPGQHRTLFYGEYSNRVRGSGLPSEPEVQAGEEQPSRKRRSPSWGRLIAKVYQVDPLLCTRCGKGMSLIAFVTDQVAVGRILDLC